MSQIFSTKFLVQAGEEMLPGLVEVLPALPTDQLPGELAPSHVAIYKTIQFMKGGPWHRSR